MLNISPLDFFGVLQQLLAAGLWETQLLGALKFRHHGILWGTTAAWRTQDSHAPKVAHCGRRAARVLVWEHMGSCGAPHLLGALKIQLLGACSVAHCGRRAAWLLVWEHMGFCGNPHLLGALKGAVNFWTTLGTSSCMDLPQLLNSLKEQARKCPLGSCSCSWVVRWWTIHCLIQVWWSGERWL